MAKRIMSLTNKRETFEMTHADSSGVRDERRLPLFVYRSLGTALALILVLVLANSSLAECKDLPHVEQRLYRAIDFWTGAVCSVHRTKTINFHVMFASCPSHVLEFIDFLLRGIGKRCQVGVLVHKYAVENWKSCDMTKGRVPGDDQWPTNLRNVSAPDLLPSMEPEQDEEHDEQMRSFEETGYVDMWRVNVIILNDGCCFGKIFEYELTVEWTAVDHFVVLSFADDEERLGSSQPSETVVETLKAFWHRRKIHNVLLCAPLSGRMNVMYTYNPFARVNEFEWGKVEMIDVKSAEQVFHALSSLTRSRTADLQGYKLNVGMFEQYQVVCKIDGRPPMGSIYEHSGGYNGSDAVVLGTIAKHMNFTVNAIEPEDGMKFGFQLPNGTYVGTMGDIVYGRVNVSFMSYFVKLYGKETNAMEFSTHVEFDRVCVVVPKAPKVPKWLRVYRIFAPSVWIFSMMLQMAMYLIWHLLQISVPHRSEEVDFQMTLYRGFLLHAGCPTKLPKSNSERILVASAFLASITMLGTISGILYKSCTQDMFYKDIDSLQQLDESSLLITMSAFGLNDLFGPPNDPEASKLMKSLRSKLRHGHRSIQQAAFFRNTSAVIRKHHYKLVRDELVDEEGSHLLHKCKECPASFYLAYLLPRHSILRERIDVLIGRLNQAGLPALWIQQQIDYLISQKRQLRSHHGYRHKSFVPFRLEDMQMSFYTLVIGLAISTIAFVNERMPFAKLIAPVFARDWKNALNACSCGIYGKMRQRRAKILRNMYRDTITR